MSATTETKPAANVAVKGGVVTYLNVDGALKAAEFYRRASARKQAMAIRRMTRGARCTCISTSMAAQ